MKKLYCLLILFFSVILLAACKRKWVDITDTWFNYDVDVCDRYFKLVECIIDKDVNESYTKEMRNDLKKEIKVIQEEWKQLSEEDLVQKCSYELDRFKSEQSNITSIGCSF